MEKSILEQSRNSKGLNGLVHKIFKKWKLLLAVGIILLLILGIFSFFEDGDTDNKVVERQIYTVAKDDITVSIETDGKVVAEDGVDLSFSTSGTTIDAIYVNEGDFVVKGAKLAKVDTTYMGIDLASAYADLEIAKANLEAKENDVTENELELALLNVEQAQANLDQIIKQNELDIEKAELDYEQAKKNLDNIDDEIEQDQLKVNQALEDSISKVNSSILAVNSSIAAIEKVLYENSYKYNKVRNLQNVIYTDLQYNVVINLYNEHKNTYDDIKFEDGEDLIMENLDSALNVIENTQEMLDLMRISLDYQSFESTYTETELESFINLITSQQSSINSQKESLINANQAIDSAKLENSEDTIQDKYDEAVISLKTAKTKADASEEDALLQLENAEIQLDQKNEGISSTDLTSLKAAVDKSQYRIDKLNYDIQLATLYAPINGEIAQLNGKVDEYIVKDTNESFVTILNKDTFYIEANVEEMDINKISVNQKIYATFDAVEGVKLTGEVSYVSLTSKTDNSGIVTYLVRILLDDVRDAGIREGMTSFVEFVISETTDVLVIPVSAVKNYEGKPSVQMENNEWLNVITGFTDGSKVEIISGLNAGDKIYK